MWTINSQMNSIKRTFSFVSAWWLFSPPLKLPRFPGCFESDWGSALPIRQICPIIVSVRWSTFPDPEIKENQTLEECSDDFQLQNLTLSFPIYYLPSRDSSSSLLWNNQAATTTGTCNWNFQLKQVGMKGLTFGAVNWNEDRLYVE